MEREAKAKVVASFWGADFFQFLAALAVLPRWIWKNRMNSTVSSKPTEAKQQARQGIASLSILLPLARHLSTAVHGHTACVQCTQYCGGELVQFSRKTCYLPPLFQSRMLFVYDV